jgi:hypothetical protein
LFSGAYADLSGKPSLFSGAYTDLSDKPILFDGAYGSLSGIPSTFTPTTHSHTVATTGTDGFMSSIDKTKLDAVTNLVEIVTKTSAFTFIIGDAGKYVRATFPTLDNITVPENATVAFPIGTSIQIRSSGAGQVTIVPAGSVLINTSETLKLRKIGSTASLIKVNTDEWDLTGDLELV